MKFTSTSTRPSTMSSDGWERGLPMMAHSQLLRSRVHPLRHPTLEYAPRIASDRPGQPITRAGPQEAILALDSVPETLLLDAF